MFLFQVEIELKRVQTEQKPVRTGWSSLLVVANIVFTFKEELLVSILLCIKTPFHNNFNRLKGNCYLSTTQKKKSLAKLFVYFAFLFNVPLIYNIIIIQSNGKTSAINE